MFFNNHSILFNRMNKSAIPLHNYHHSSSADSFDGKIKKMLQEYDEWKSNPNSFTLDELKKYVTYWLEKSNKLDDIKYTHDSADSVYWTWAACYNWIVCKITKDVQNHYLTQLERHIAVTDSEKKLSVSLTQ